MTAPSPQFCALLSVLAWTLTGCLLPGAPKSQGERPQEKGPAPVDMTLLLALVESHAEGQGLFTLAPSAGREKREQEPQKKPEPQAPPAPHKEDPPTAVQEAPGPAADDQLLGLWQKDLERALEQPSGRRRIQFSIPVVENDRVRYFVSLFSGRLRQFFERALARSGKYIPMMATILQEEGLPEDLVYLSLIESGFSPAAYSKAKALGPWQFIRDTGLRYGLTINGWIDERRDPVKSTRAAAAYLKDLHFQFGEWFLAAAAYNAGERKVEKAVDRSHTNDFWSLSQKNYLKLETRNYVPKFIAAALIAGTPEKYGFGGIAYESPMEYDEVRVKGALKLTTVAQMANTNVQTIKELNPALLRDVTPPYEDDFALRLPTGSGEIFALWYASLPRPATVNVITHKVNKGETLLGIAKRYNQQVGALMDLNGLKNHVIRVGQDLIVLLEGARKKK